MQHELNHTVQALLGARGLDEVSRENLSALVREHPYSALLHLLYSKKLQQAKDPQFAESVARTALYFSNPHWLHHLLRPKTSRDAVQEMEQAFADHALEAPAVHGAEITEPVDAEAPVAIPVESTEEVVPQEPDLSPTEETLQPSPERSQTAWQEPGIRALETIPEIPGFGLPSPETVDTDQTPDASAPVREIAGGTTLPSTGPLLPVDLGPLPLEPYYTIDYFASQGIQLSEDEKQDPLGRKLKKFTEWLKTMKKIHPDKSGPAAGEGQSEETIREGAEHSNERADVVTEAMAEVYAKQGQPEKAREIYRKLSLLDPARSATFAAKIGELNNPDR